MAAATAAAAATGAPKFLLRCRHSPSSGPANNFMASSKAAIHIPHCFSSTRAKGSFPIRALDPRRRQEEEEAEENSSIVNNATGFNYRNDLEYLGMLLAGSIVGGAVIKYGSIVFPEITRPNIILALIMIFTPVIIATLLLIKLLATLTPCLNQA
ncbi:hypothetical protein RchiOBHm_Chr2g0134971 [Rosa chinensis]|uniref:Uncharacterized protein n=1 Tax=Rosa chinensis TaxID=74649 RepID=A0A2P6RVY8_ROSCH|nr:uncharacterized protein LOC112185247 [Rosa chinensis]PRQ50595.1 hypothetical protein RchiOBHm_Chr2g0134971 [Rosa chinensis]